MDNILYHTGKCCYPIPGDTLVGFVTIGKGVTIHRKDCPNLGRIAYEDSRLVDVTWQTSDEARAQARVLVETVDRPGILANLSALISSVNVNISHLSATTSSDRQAHITIILAVKNNAQLQTLIHKIGQIEGVLRVRR
jgi:GTP pyrophosphokinase